MTLIASHITAFLQQRLPIERSASPNTCDSYAYAFKLLFEYASDCIKIARSSKERRQHRRPAIPRYGRKPCMPADRRAPMQRRRGSLPIRSMTSKGDSSRVWTAPGRADHFPFVIRHHYCPNVF